MKHIILTTALLIVISISSNISQAANVACTPSLAQKTYKTEPTIQLLGLLSKEGHCSKEITTCFAYALEGSTRVSHNKFAPYRVMNLSVGSEILFSTDYDKIYLDSEREKYVSWLNFLASSTVELVKLQVCSNVEFNLK